MSRPATPPAPDAAEASAAPALGCRTCPYWVGPREMPEAARAYIDASRGDCRRYPTPVRRLGEEWCGEHPHFRREGDHAE